MNARINEKTNPASAIVGEEIRFSVGATSLGLVLVAHSGKGICAVLIDGDRSELERELRRRLPKAVLREDSSGLAELVARIAGFVEDPSRGLAVALDERGTDFQRRVWKALREIPPGATATYSGVAERLGAPRSFRAVARACALNPLAVVTPCHRVVGKDGSLTGYRWGIDRKRELLRREAGKIPPDRHQETQA